MFGTIYHACPWIKGGKREPARWYVHARPHVVVRLKRWMANLRQDYVLVAPGQAERLPSVSDGPEAVADLALFLQRFPMEVQCPEHFEARGGEQVARQASLAALLAPGYEPPTVDLAIPLRPYQRAAVDWQWRTGGLLLADDVGLGKTGSAIGTLTRPDRLPAVVVTLPLLPAQWKREVERFAPGLRVLVPKSAKPEELFDLRGRHGADPGWTPATWLAADVIVINYHKLAKLGPLLAKWARTVIWDEAQELRRDESEKYRAAHHLAGAVAYRMALSATPIHNYGGEMFHVLECTSPGALGTRDEFHREYCSGSPARLKDPAAFGSYLRDAGLMLRRTRAEVGRELPKLSKIVVDLELDLEAIDRIATPAAELARIILAQGGGLRRGAQMEAAGQFSMWLRQATGIAKARPTAEFVRLLAEGGEPVLLYGFHHAVYDLWADLLKDFRPAFVTGRESPAAKRESLGRFVAGDAKVLILSTRAGAGLDGLQHACRTVVYGELDFSPAVHEQGIGRVFRDGQADPVLAYFLVGDDGSDPVISDILGLKTQQIEALINPDGELFERAEVDPGHVKRLAEDFLKRRGLPLPEPAPDPAP